MIFATDLSRMSVEKKVTVKAISTKSAHASAKDHSNFRAFGKWDVSSFFFFSFFFCFSDIDSRHL